MEHDDAIQQVTHWDVHRLIFPAGCPEPDSILFEFILEAGDEPCLVYMRDVEAYALIRRMTDVLFSAERDPPRSGVGSPGHSA